MRKITLCFSLLLAITATAQGNGGKSETPSQSFTPVNALTEGWYQLKVTDGDANRSDRTTLQGYATAGTNWIVATNNEYRQVSNQNINWYSLKYADLYRSTDPVPYAASFIYITPTGGNSYTVQGINGHYVSDYCTASRTAVNNTITYKNNETFTILHWNFYDAGEESPLVGRSQNTNNIYQFSSVNIEEYDVYTVQISGVPASSEIGKDPQVTCKNDANMGIRRVYQNGKFFFPTDTEITEADFEATEIRGYSYEININDADNAKTITVTYTEWNAEDVYQHIKTELAKFGKWVGYPISVPVNVQTALNAAEEALGNTGDALSATHVLSANAQTDDENSDNEEQSFEDAVEALQEAYNAIWAGTDISKIKKPEDGTIYRLISVLENGIKRYLYVDGTEIKWKNEPVEDASGYFICQQIGANVKLASLMASGLFSEEHTINEKGTRFFFDVKKAHSIGHTMLIVDSQPKNTENQAYRSISTEPNNVLGVYTNNQNNPNNVGSIQEIVNTNSSTDFIFEEVVKNINGDGNDGDGDNNGKINEEYKYKVNLTRGHNREDVYSYYGTLYLPFAVTLPEYVKAYMVKPSDDWTILEEVELSLGDENTLPAGTPVLLKGEIGEEETSEATAEGSNIPKKYTFTIAANAGATATVADTEGDNAGSSIEDNGLRGRCSDGDPEDGTAYILALTNAESDREVRFFRLADGQQVNGNKAYYLIPTASGTSLATIALSGGNRVTAIENAATTTTDAAAACYDLSGRQVTKPAAGLYIVGGKKVFVK